jgi:hypothetical protein
MNGGEIAKDGVRLPDHQVAVDQGRDLGIRIELAVRVRERIAELATVILTDVGDTGFLQTEDDLLDVS